VVESGPVKDNIVEGDDIDLWQFPAPKWHATDGGRYIDTFCGVVTEDKVTGRDNIGVYRGQVVDRDKIAKLMVPTQGWGGHFQEYKPEPMPVAVVYGWHDVLPFCAGSPFPKDVCEWDMMGAVLGRPVDLVACESVPLHVPASAEIVVEGFLDPDPATFMEEGPFAEYPGYLDGHPAPTPVLRVTRITHRHDPVLRGTLEGIRPGFLVEDAMVNYARSAIAWGMLEGLGVGGITDVWMSQVSNGTNIVVQIHKAYRGHAQQVAAALWGTPVDPGGSTSTSWSLRRISTSTTRRRSTGQWHIGSTRGSAISRSMGRRSGHRWIRPPRPRKRIWPSTVPAEWHRVLIDATRSWEFEPRPEWGGRHYPAINKIAPELEARIAARWEEYGIGIPYLDEARRELLTMEQLSKRLPDV
jgi:3-polyprenyl-4-hydroxybenzoate decarboxylase